MAGEHEGAGDWADDPRTFAERVTDAASALTERDQLKEYLAGIEAELAGYSDDVIAEAQRQVNAAPAGPANAAPPVPENDNVALPQPRQRAD